MKENIIKFEKLFNEIKKRGWIKVSENGPGGAGITFEHLIGKDKENFEIPDFEGIEIKTKKNKTIYSYITLFNYTPESKYINETQRLKNNYGYPDSNLKEYKVLNNSFFVNERKWVGKKHQFLLKFNKLEGRLYLHVLNVNGELVEKESYWTFETMEDKILRKLNMLAMIKVENKKNDGIEYCKYTSATFYKFKGMNVFLDLLEKGIIRLTFKIGVFKSGKRFGQTHDHGTGFEIDKRNINKLYDIYEF